MTTITLQGKPIHTVGDLPQVGSHAPAFQLTQSDLSEITHKDLSQTKLILNVFPSLDTDVCAASVRRFNAEASALPNTKVLCISMDLPFAHQRFCTTENITNVMSCSVFRHPEFGKDFGVTIIDGPLAGLMSRAIVIIDETGKVIYTEQVPEISQEPNYDAALQAAK